MNIGLNLEVEFDGFGIMLITAIARIIHVCLMITSGRKTKMEIREKIQSGNPQIPDSQHLIRTITKRPKQLSGQLALLR